MPYNLRSSKKFQCENKEEINSKEFDNYCRQIDRLNAFYSKGMPETMEKECFTGDCATLKRQETKELQVETEKNPEKEKVNFVYLFILLLISTFSVHVLLVLLMKSTTDCEVTLGERWEWL